MEVTIGATISDVAVKFDEAVFKGIINDRVVSAFFNLNSLPSPSSRLPYLLKTEMSYPELRFIKFYYAFIPKKATSK
ncbi:hypothetical protein [Chryseobacterium jejuense]|uniref:hypothetical protein n=1 Tax=Chryseobacterium jejuense TaxID=445960 RepID=UPI001AEA60ED|nr:hypothetical protein [Chryseobacterium jejuense]MBP2615777.1 hypothetical protein [Chryseobacterium jejuense]